MNRDNIVIKGNKEGLNAIINMDNFKDFDDMLDSLIEKLSKGKKFYKGCTLKITTDIRLINENQAKKLREILFEEILIKDCIFEDKEEKTNKVFSGIYEGRTKFIRKTVRSGQIIRYSGNIVIIGDVNPGSEIHAEGNVIVMGNLRGQVRAGITGNERAIIVAFNLQPEILQIASIITRAPEDSLKPEYPEVAKIKEGSIIVEPYVVNKYI
ncbi:septum site-determining protein MinC [Clostridium algidicarnis]|uniref:septum site-determining protein MinC n=1 Tax=Clostridium algidicarnis TaxID=37659 RepID=UPI001C0D201F|nr:septum site-determining protein MinC [Clostridium algidicarnis]MBU3196049.1 septum site-determining protein MinC [Clostridium algidicarnis]MBU3209094.1 septum site-determining protein MinC [Clostridium algidicarnis]MBU3228968.1 septum site-determining protein MinC [Clostridium algidicarnis]MBU3252512.1 septum site-determining protein MinC [Clostridium algidicarnis]